MCTQSQLLKFNIPSSYYTCTHCSEFHSLRCRGGIKCREVMEQGGNIWGGGGEGGGGRGWSGCGKWKQRLWNAGDVWWMLVCCATYLHTGGWRAVGPRKKDCFCSLRCNINLCFFSLVYCNIIKYKAWFFFFWVIVVYCIIENFWLCFLLQKLEPIIMNLDSNLLPEPLSDQPVSSITFQLLLSRETIPLSAR